MISLQRQRALKNARYLPKIYGSLEGVKEECSWRCGGPGRSSWVDGAG